MSPKFTSQQVSEWCIKTVVGMTIVLVLIMATVATPLTWGWVFGISILIVVLYASLTFGYQRLYATRYVVVQPDRQVASPNSSREESSPDDTQEIPLIRSVGSSYRDGMPEPYHHIRHWKFFGKEALVAIAVTAVGVFSTLTAAVIMPRISDARATMFVVLVALLLALFGVFFSERARRVIWRSRPIDLDPEDGVLRIGQAGSRKWVVRGSSPDTYPLDEFSVKTPPQTWFETYVPGFKNSQTLQLVAMGGEGNKVVLELRDVVDVDAILAIQRWRGRVHQEDNELMRRLIEVTERQLAVSEANYRATMLNREPDRH